MKQKKQIETRVRKICKKAISGVTAASLIAAATGGCAVSEPPSSQQVYTSPAKAAPQQSTSQTDKTNSTQQDTSDANSYPYPCFITTVCVETMGLPDDCHEMTILRRFRDGYLMQSELGRKAVEHYHRIAPPIVLAIRQSDNPVSECRHIYDSLINPCVELIEAGKPQEAFVYYRDGVFALARKYSVEDTF